MSDSTDRQRAAATVPGLDPLLSLAMCVHAGPGVYALLLGAGMSKHAGVPTGWEIVTDLVRRAAVARGADDQEAAASAADPEAWWSRHGDGSPLGYSALLEALADTPAARHQLLRGYFEADEQERRDGLKQPGAAHRAVAELVARGWVRVVLTTNFDRLIERSLEAAGVQPQVISSPPGLRGMTPLAHARATVVKLHGDIADLESRNTEEELRDYPAAWSGLVDQVLDEYGLVVCGWSAQWDRALVECFERRASRRFPLFWSTRGRPGEKAGELIARHRAEVIPGLTAEQLFPGLLSRIEALARLAAPAPSREVAVARLKRCLPAPVRRIDVHDLLESETARVVERLTDPTGFPPGLGAGPAYEERLERYRSDCDTLLHLLSVGVFHDSDSGHTRVWARVLQRLVSARGAPGAAQDTAPESPVQLCPALLALAACGTAAVLGGREDVVGRLLLEPVGGDHCGSGSGPRPAVLALRTTEVFGDGERLNALLGSPYPPPRARLSHSRWLRHRLREVLAEPAAGSDRVFREAFDRYEYLAALVQADLDQGPPVPGEFALPDRRDADGRLRVSAQVQAGFTDDWPMLAGGAFGGRLDRAHTAAAVVDVECDRWFGLS